MNFSAWKDKLLGYMPTMYIDYEGQRLSEQIYQIVISVFTVIAFLWGYYCQQLSYSLYILGAGVVLSALLVIPPWPMYRRNSLTWAPPVPDTFEPKASFRSGGKKSGKR